MFLYMGKNGGILGIFALLTTALIAITFYATKDTIALAKEQQLLGVLNELVPESAHDNQLHTDCIIVSPDPLLGDQSQRIFRARNANERVALIIETTAPDGYSGNIELVVAIDTKQTVLGARVLEHKETPGLGDKIDLRVSDWILSFTGVSYSEQTEARWQVKKDGGQFDQFTGATITPRAVINAVKNAVIYVNQNQQTLYESAANCNAQKGMVEINVVESTDE
jgi:electron transport complex protein RnfG